MRFALPPSFILLSSTTPSVSYYAWTNAEPNLRSMFSLTRILSAICYQFLSFYENTEHVAFLFIQFCCRTFVCLGSSLFAHVLPFPLYSQTTTRNWLIVTHCTDAQPQLVYYKLSFHLSGTFNCPKHLSQLYTKGFGPASDVVQNGYSKYILTCS